MIFEKKLFILFGMIALYLLSGLLFKILLSQGIITRAAPIDVNTLSTSTPYEGQISLALQAAQIFFESTLQKDGHIDLYHVINTSQSFDYQNYTNSEAVSYYLLWTAKAKEKAAFDKELNYIEENMLHKKGYLMWRLSPLDLPIDDGTNIASDADLRAIYALIIAEEQWGDSRYTKLIHTIAEGLEEIAITNDSMLAPYGGYSGETPWRTNEVWLSYMHFPAVKTLAKRRGEPWTTLYSQMKAAILHAQIANGLYNSVLTVERQYGNSIDNGGYSINSLWMMVRSAESEDPELMESARKSLEFYKQHFTSDESIIYTAYSSSGDPLSSYDAPWVYALIGRAAVALGDTAAARQFVGKLSTFQITDENSTAYGAIPEGLGEVPRVGQFTMQESILTFQAYIQKFEEVEP